MPCGTRNVLAPHERISLPVLRIDLEDGRILQQLGRSRVEAAARTMEDKHVTIGVDGDAGGFAHLHAGGQPWPAFHFFVIGCRLAR